MDSWIGEQSDEIVKRDDGCHLGAAVLRLPGLEPGVLGNLPCILPAPQGIPGPAKFVGVEDDLRSRMREGTIASEGKRFACVEMQQSLAPANRFHPGGSDRAARREHTRPALNILPRKPSVRCRNESAHARRAPRPRADAGHAHARRWTSGHEQTRVRTTMLPNRGPRSALRPHTRTRAESVVPDCHTTTRNRVHARR